MSPLKEAMVLKPEILEKGGNILVVPFSAGTGVAADNDLDRISLMIVKGISDVLGERGSRFKLLSSSDSQSADIIIKGRIVEVEEKTGLSKPWGKKPKTLTLAVEGSVLEVENEELTAKFAQIKNAKGTDVHLKDLAYQLGTEIGHFLAGDLQR